MKTADKRQLRERVAWIALALFVIAACKYVSDAYFQLMLIQGDSMQPSYHNMQLVILDKRNRNYRTGDVIAFRREGLDAVLVKRIAAVPGDSAFIENSTLKVNGETAPFYEEGAFSFAGMLEHCIQLSEGEYIVFGDNLEQSKDSRYGEVGIVRQGSIIGKVITR